MKKKKLGINDAIEHTPIHSFEGADKKAQEYEELKNGVTQQVKKAGRPTVGKSKATNKIAFMVDDEVHEYLESLTDKKDRTPNAVAKKLLMANYEIHGKKE